MILVKGEQGFAAVYCKAVRVCMLLRQIPKSHLSDSLAHHVP